MLPTCFFGALLVALSIGLAPQAGAQAFQEGVNRPGVFYSTVTTPSPRRCQSACVNEGLCRAWVFIKISKVENCQLKLEMPPAVVDQCCVSGVVQ
jgi:hypothetical protein